MHGGSGVARTLPVEGARGYNGTRTRLAEMRPEIDRRVAWALRFDDRRRAIPLAYVLVKRLTDLLLIIVCAPAWLPMLGLCCILVKIGAPHDPVLFVQRRTGMNGRRFSMLKIRTMVPDAETLLPRFLHLNERTGPEIKIRNDPRVTRFGKLLRRTYLDELPQLINVLRGEMSLVGPRPTSAPTEVYEPWQHGRLVAPPGMTGLWQIVQDDVNDFSEHMLLDIVYVQRRCWLLDMEILLRTIGFVAANSWGAIRKASADRPSA